TGSISAAGKAMGMSYKRAWGLVQALNEGFGRPLVETARGGAGQGGAQLTALGRDVLARYRAMEQAPDAAIAPEVAALRALISDLSQYIYRLRRTRLLPIDVFSRTYRRLPCPVCCFLSLRSRSRCRRLLPKRSMWPWPPTLPRWRRSWPN